MRQILKDVTWLLGQGMDCNVFLFESEGESLLIDSGLGKRGSLSFSIQKNSSNDLEQVLIEKNVTQVLLTHSHIDHVGGVMDLQSRLELEIIASKIESKHLKSGDSAFIEPFLGSKCSPIKISKEVTGGSVIQVGTFSFVVLHTPGHTYGSISLWDKEKQILVSGDTVFPQGSFGRTDLLSGSSKDLISSLKQLSELDAKILLPGHMPPLISASDSTKNSIKRSYKIAREMLFYD